MIRMLEKFEAVLGKELERLDSNNTSKRHERVIEGFVQQGNNAPKAVIRGEQYAVFNSNDYLGFRFHPRIKKAEAAASEKYGAGPGAVRFISGSLRIHRELEKALAEFHNRDDAIIFSSAFAANLAVIHCLIKGQSRDSVVGSSTLVVSDELNHRSIIDGIRVAGVPKENKAIFRHMDYGDLLRVLEENKGRTDRALVLSDGVFSMLGEAADIGRLSKAAEAASEWFKEGVVTFVDDAHGIGVLGDNGKGCEELFNASADVLVGTMGKALGSDGGYVVSSQKVADYLRESAATYVYSNPVSPGTAAAALEALRILKSEEGKEILARLRKNIDFFKEKMKSEGFEFAADSSHPIQPILVGDPGRTRRMVKHLFDSRVLVTQISYPVVPKGRDEIRVQLSAIHTEQDIEEFVEKARDAGKAAGLL